MNPFGSDCDWDGEEFTPESAGSPLEAWRVEQLMRANGITSVRELPVGYHGRFDMLSVDDVKFLIACGIDPIEEAPPDMRIWKPREELS